MITLKSEPQNKGQLLQQGLDLYFHTLWWTLPFSLIGAAFIFLPQLLSQLLPLIDHNNSFYFSQFGLYGFSLMASFLFIGALSFRIYCVCYHIPSSFLLALKQSLFKFIPLLLLVMLYSLIVLSGTMLMIVPGIILTVSLMFSFLLVLTDNQSVLQTLIASHRLVWGNWWHTCLVISIPILLDFIFSFSLLIGIVTFAATKMLSLISILSLVTITNIIIHSFFIPLICCIALVLLHDLRQRQHILQSQW